MKILSAKENKEILEDAKATLAVEGLIITEKESKLFQDYLEGLITKDEILNVMKSKGIN